MIKKRNMLLGSFVSGLLSLYQYTLSPDKGVFSRFLKGRICAHEPHCSAYGKECLRRYGFWPGIAYTVERIFSCVPRREKIYDPSVYRVVFFSGSPIGNSFLTQLNKDKRFEVVGVVTMPDKPIGRGHHVQENSIAQTAGVLGIKNIFKRSTLKNPDHATVLQSLQADFFVVVAYGKIIPSHILAIPSFGAINMHGSILPEYRGASPIQSVFLDDKKETGRTIIAMNERMDEGDIIAIHSFPIPFSRTAKDVFTLFGETGPEFLNDTLREYGKGRLTSYPQPEQGATYCKKSEKQHGEIDLIKTPLCTVYNAYRGYSIRPKIWALGPTCFPKIAGKLLIIEDLVCQEDIYTIHCNKPLMDITGALNPAVKTLAIKVPGKKKSSWEDFFHGYIRQ